MSYFKNKKIAFIEIPRYTEEKIKELLKSLNCRVLKTISKNIDIFVFNPYLVGPSSRYRSMIYQKENNNKIVLTYEEFLKKAEADGIDVSAIKSEGTPYKTNTRRNKLKSLILAIKDNAHFQKCESVLKFNDDVYEVEYSRGNRQSFTIDEDVKKAISKALPTFVVSPQYSSDIYDIIDKCGGYCCIEKVMAVCIAIKQFYDPSFECKFRIYRDKWEYRGDYAGMCCNEWEIPPAIYWEISDKHPWGWTSFGAY